MVIIVWEQKVLSLNLTMSFLVRGTDSYVLGHMRGLYEDRGCDIMLVVRPVSHLEGSHR
jgi:hypothetical protein